MNPIDEIQKKVERIQARFTKPGTREWTVLQQALLAINDTAEKFHFEELGRTTDKPCPVCGKPLNETQNTDGVHVFCAHGDCPGRCTNHGAFGPNTDAAHGILQRMVEVEQEEGAETA